MKEYKIEKRRDQDGNEYVGISGDTDTLLAGINDQLGEHDLELRIGVTNDPSSYDYYYSVVKDVSQQNTKDKNFESETRSYKEWIANLTKKINAIQDCNDYKLTGAQ